MHRPLRCGLSILADNGLYCLLTVWQSKTNLHNTETVHLSPMSAMFSYCIVTLYRHISNRAQSADSAFELLFMDHMAAQKGDVSTCGKC